MKLKSAYIIIDNMRLYAHHGVMEQEQRVGAYFTITLRVHYYIYKAMMSDRVRDAISYADVADVVRQEMATPSHLLEHVVGRIAKAIFDRFPQCTAVDIKLMKDNPPMGIDCDGAGVEARFKRRQSEQDTE